MAVGRNRRIQRQYWKLFKNGIWPEYHVSTPGKGVDSILERDPASEFDLDNPDALTSIIETTTAAFIGDIEKFLSRHQPLQVNADLKHTGSK